MSQPSLEAILSRAMSDQTFADLLFSDLGTAVSGYELTADEIAGLKNLARAEFDQVTHGTPQDRKSFAWMQHNEIALHME